MKTNKINTLTVFITSAACSLALTSPANAATEARTPTYNATACVYDASTGEMTRDDSKAVTIYSVFNGANDEAPVIDRELPINSSADVINNLNNFGEYYLWFTDNTDLDAPNSAEVQTDDGNNTPAPAQAVVTVTNLDDISPDGEPVHLERSIMPVEQTDIDVNKCTLTLDTHKARHLR